MDWTEGISVEASDWLFVLSVEVGMICDGAGTLCRICSSLGRASAVARIP
jgi:hypothetical protein